MSEVVVEEEHPFALKCSGLQPTLASLYGGDLSTSGLPSPLFGASRAPPMARVENHLEIQNDKNS